MRTFVIVLIIPLLLFMVSCEGQLPSQSKPQENETQENEQTETQEGTTLSDMRIWEGTRVILTNFSGGEDYEDFGGAYMLDGEILMEIGEKVGSDLSILLKVYSIEDGTFTQSYEAKRVENFGDYAISPYLEGIVGGFEGGKWMVYGDPESEHLMIYYLTDDGSYMKDLAQECEYERLTYMYPWEDKMYNYGDELYLNLSDTICRISFLEDGISVDRYDIGMNVDGFARIKKGGEFAVVSSRTVIKYTPSGSEMRTYDNITDLWGIPFVRDGKLYDAGSFGVDQEGIAVIDLDTMDISTKTLNLSADDVYYWIYYLIPYDDEILVLLYYVNSFDTETPYHPGFMLLDSNLNPIVDATTNFYFNACKYAPSRPTGYGIDDEGRLWVEFCNNVLVIDEDGNFTTTVFSYSEGKFLDVYGDKAYRIYRDTYYGNTLIEDLYLSE